MRQMTNNIMLTQLQDNKPMLFQKNKQTFIIQLVPPQTPILFFFFLVPNSGRLG